MKVLHSLVVKATPTSGSNAGTDKDKQIHVEEVAQHYKPNQVQTMNELSINLDCCTKIKQTCVCVLIHPVFY